LLCIRSRFAVRDRLQRRPRFALKLRSLRIDLHFEVTQLAGEVLIQLAARLIDDLVAAELVLRQRIFAAFELDLDKRLAVRGERERANRAVIDGADHVWMPFLATRRHKRMAAYAGHGLICSSVSPLRPSALISAMSVAGEASGAPSARMATYSTVHGPIPGMSARAARSAAVAPRAGGGWPSRDATARRCKVSPRFIGRPIFAISAAPALASVAASGKARSRPSGARSSVAPYFATRRSVSVRAPCTVTCWPSTARIAVSK